MNGCGQTRISSLIRSDSSSVSAVVSTVCTLYHTRLDLIVDDLIRDCMHALAQRVSLHGCLSDPQRPETTNGIDVA